MRSLLVVGMLLSAQCAAPEEKSEDPATSPVEPRSTADELGVSMIDPDRIRAMGDEEAAAYVARLTAEVERRREQLLAAPRDPQDPPRPLVVVRGDADQPPAIARKPSGDPIFDTELPAVLPRASVEPEQQPDAARTIRLEIVCTNFGALVPPRSGTKRIPDTGSIALEGHEVHFVLAGERIDRLRALRRRLRALARDPSSRVPDPSRPGETMLKAVLVAPGKNTTYGDVAGTVDAVTGAGFHEIIFGGELGSRGAR